jgi:RHS repeat-associated protein
LRLGEKNGLENVLSQSRKERKTLRIKELKRFFSWREEWTELGNPLTREENGQVRTYTFNNLNQFASATRPSVTDVRGTVGPTLAEPSVKVNDVPVTVDAEGNFVREDVPLTSGPNQIVIEVKDKYNRTASVTRNVTRDTAPPTFSYDLNGNTTGDGLWTFTWNEENRLSEAVCNVGASSCWRRLTFTYDGLGRRRTKLVSSWTGSAWDPESEIRFVYDGNNLVAELDGLDDNAILRSYVWGVDLSGTFDGAAGVGGLLMVSTFSPQPSAYYPLFDANGNITAYLDASDNAVYTAEYSPFGKITATTGTAPAQFGFSTIYRDQETGFLVYRFRYYDPNLGRWPSRDPMGEMGGVNLYAMVGNNPASVIDAFGMYPIYHNGYSHEATIQDGIAYINIDDDMAKHYGLDPKYFSEMPLEKFAEAVEASGGSSELLGNILQAMQGAAAQSRGYYDGGHPADYAHLRVTRSECGNTQYTMLAAAIQCRKRIGLMASSNAIRAALTGVPEGIVTVFGGFLAASAPLSPLGGIGGAAAIGLSGKAIKDLVTAFTALSAGQTAMDRYCDCCNIK